MVPYQYPRSYELFEEAKKYIPNGIPMPRTPLFLTFGQHPVFLGGAKGARFTDMDGNEFIDFMCAYGAVLLGYNHPKVEEAAAAQREKGNSTSIPGPIWVEFAKFMTREIPMAEFMVYGKNGSDVTTWAAMLARTHTGRNGIVMAEHAYHGLHNWCIESDVGIPEEYKAHTYKFRYNDTEDLEEVVENNRGKLAAVFLTPVGHWAMADQELPEPGFYEKVREICDREGLLMLVDDIRCGFRYDYRGTHAYFSRVEPDVICFAKAISNGYPLSVAVAKSEYMEAAKKIYWSATHFYSAVPIAAAKATVEEIKASGAIERIAEIGARFQEGLRQQANSHGVAASVTGHPSMPFMTFAEDPTLEKNRFFCGEAARRGVFLHPHHNWFVSAALTDEDLDKTLEVTDACMKLTKEKYGG